jgi:hypothetical protein
MCGTIDPSHICDEYLVLLTKSGMTSPELPRLHEAVLQLPHVFLSLLDVLQSLQEAADWRTFGGVLGSRVALIVHQNSMYLGYYL